MRERGIFLALWRFVLNGVWGVVKAHFFTCDMSTFLRVPCPLFEASRGPLLMR
jgi:hypothetical protein